MTKQMMLIGTSVSLLLLVIVAGFSCTQNLGKSQLSQSETTPNPGVLARSYDDDPVLVGSAEHVLAGKVLRQVGSDPRIGNPHNQFEVEVLYNIKGELQGTVVVDNDYSTIPPEDHFAVGSTYLIAARYSPDFGPYYYAGGYDAFVTLISNDSSKSNPDLLKEIIKSPKTQSLLRAYPNEQLSQRDIERGHTQNSFVSLTEDQNQAVYDRIESLPAADN
jgi:hypothetical protein